MSMPRFKPSAAYKDSGVEWLGEIPAHWEITPADRSDGIHRQVTQNVGIHDDHADVLR